MKDRWFDAGYQVDSFIESIRDRKFYAETFPVFWPNLDPEVFTAFHGSKLEHFIATMDPKGIMLCIAADERDQPDIIKRIEKW